MLAKETHTPAFHQPQPPRTTNHACTHVSVCIYMLCTFIYTHPLCYTPLCLPTCPRMQYTTNKAPPPLKTASPLSPSLLCLGSASSTCAFWTTRASVLSCTSFSTSRSPPRVCYFTCVYVCVCACMCVTHICLLLAVFVCMCEDVCAWCRLPEQIIIQSVLYKIIESVKMMKSHITVIASEWVAENKIIKWTSWKIIRRMDKVSKSKKKTKIR